MIEVIRSGKTAARAKVAILDFDGTLSVLRSGWMEIMIPLCTDQLAVLETGESKAELRSVVEEFVWRLTGKETIYQMMALADAIHARGGSPLPPLEYKKMYLDRLWERIRGRIEALRSRSEPASHYLVPGAAELLQYLTARGLTLYLASGTDDANVKEEAQLLGLDHFFEGRIYGAKDDLTSFSKAMLVRQILSASEEAAKQPLSPSELLVFGDGFVEIEEVSKVGGVAVGVASQEPDCREIDEWKRKRLILAGADFLVPNFLNLEELQALVFPPSFMKQ